MKYKPFESYTLISDVIQHIQDHIDQPLSLNNLAQSIGLDKPAFHQLFINWCGLSPKAFLQTQRLDYARKLLRNQNTVLDTALDVGLSGTGRLHDLFIRYEAMPPGVYRAKGAGITLKLGWHESPFGAVLLALSSYGLAALSFANEGEQKKVENELQARWPNADYIFDAEATLPYIERIFNPNLWHPNNPMTLAPIGSDFDIKVWSQLTTIPHGQFSTYGKVAQALGKPKGAARAVGGAVGRNPLAFIIPCHRVVGSNGALTGYHWGLIRKRALIGWEAGLLRHE